MSWLTKLVDRMVPRHSNYEAALHAIREGNRSSLESLLRQSPPLIRASYCISGSLLHNAAMDGQVEITELLIAMGARVNDASTRDTETPLHFAAYAGKLGTIRVLVAHGADINALCCQSTQSPLDAAVWSHGGAHKDVVRYLLESGAEHSGIHVASVLGDTERAEAELASGGDPNSRDRSGYSPLHWAVRGGDTARMMIDFLISRGADVEGRATKGTATPLYVAASAGNLAAVEALVAYGADASAEAAFGGTPLRAAQSHREVADFLLRNGADACAADAFGETALHDAAAENDVRMLRDLLERGCDPNALSLMVPQRLPGGRQVRKMMPGNPWTPLHIAASYGHTPSAELLIEHGADVNGQDHHGHTPLHTAASDGQAEMASLLLSHGADPTARDRKGRTALDLALKANQEDVISVLRGWESGSRAASGDSG